MSLVSLLLISSLLLLGCTSPTSRSETTGQTTENSTITDTEALNNDGAQKPESEGLREIDVELIKTSEQLLAKAPHDWKLIYQINNGEIKLTDYIPATEEADNWITKLSFEAHTSLVEIDPITVIMGEIEKSNESCRHLEHSNLFSGLENNYPTSVRLIECGENAMSEKGEITLTKVIQGNEHFYVIRLVKRVAPFKRHQANIMPQEVANWADYLKRIKLCDPEKPDHSCPQT